MSKVDVLLGLQWGDEGKGKVVDVLTPKYDVVARFQGGPNAGHTLEFDGKKFVLRSIPSGVFQGGKTNIIGNGVVLDPLLFREEAEALEESGLNLKERLLISHKAHLILPTHRLLDAANEASKAGTKIGTTGKGIGPTYTDKISRNGLRVGDTLMPDFKEKYESHKKRHMAMLAALDYDGHTETEDFKQLERDWLDAVEYLKLYEMVDGEFYINGMIEKGKTILAEGAQGSLLDVDYGSYPFVTSSNTIASGACVGLGVAPSRVGRVFGIMKAYCTRVGEGPFPTELHDEVGDEMCERGREFGSVTGRKRRCGWLDLVALKYTTMLSGVTDLFMMKGDVLDTFDEIKVCTSYKINGEQTEHFPYSIEHDIEPIYHTLPGWKSDLSGIRSEEDFPANFSAYIKYIEEFLGIPVSIVSVGPDRDQTILRNDL
ncbi:MAG: adenylosuccinate synthase [Porphyromonas sp.]|nr:adenylosuccinate synthase [Porphyromonas sp.]